MTTPLHTLIRRLAERFPTLDAAFDAPAAPDGTWWADLTLGAAAVTVSWAPDGPFTVTARPALYGERPDEAFDTADAAYDRVVRLVLSGAPTRPPEMDLQGLRKHRSVRQQDLAAALDISQPSVSKLERRPDVKVGTLAATVEALGGELEVTARFPDEVVRLRFSKPDA